MNKLITILTSGHEREYIGEPVSQLEHALQAAYFATKSGAHELQILAALLHDIGHLIGHEALDETNNLGVKQHESVGAEFLATMGAPQLVCELVRSHVDAKRYLVFKNADYRRKLSDASLQTLALQGGAMCQEEATAFERDPLFREKVALRNFDERAKVAGLVVPPCESYQALFERHFTR